MTLPFPSLIMSLISKVRVKLPSGLPVLSRVDPISAHTITRSKSYILGQVREAGEAQAQREEVEGEGDSIEDEIDRFTLRSEDIPQSSTHVPARAPDFLDHLLDKVEQMHSLMSEHIT